MSDGIPFNFTQSFYAGLYRVRYSTLPLLLTLATTVNMIVRKHHKSTLCSTRNKWHVKKDKGKSVLVMTKGTKVTPSSKKSIP